MKKILFLSVCISLLSSLAQAGEASFGYVQGTETLPKGAVEVIQNLTKRWDKGQGTYTAYDSKTEFEYGFTDRFTGAVYLLGNSVNTAGLQIDGYLPADIDTGMKYSGFEISAKYNLLSPVKDDFGLAIYASGLSTHLDPHSGQNKDKYTIETWLLAQKNFLDDQLVWVANVGLESTYAKRYPIAGMVLTQEEWPTTPEMEIATLIGTGISYRVAANWFVGVEALYDAEYETEVGQERWSIQAGPNIHYGAKDWWFTATWLPQLKGGGFENYPGQTDTNLHLIEKTKQEFRLKIGFNF